MNRLYRGKRIDNGEWVCGWYTEAYTPSSAYRRIGPFIEWFEDECLHSEEVHPDSVKIEVCGHWFSEKELSDIVKKVLTSSNKGLQ